MKAARIRPYGWDYDRHGTVCTLQYLCWMNDGTLLIVSVAATYRGNEKNRAVRAEAARAWERQRKEKGKCQQQT